MKETSLASHHRAAGGKMVDFSGWQMPLHYGSQIDEHHAVRQSVGMFDVSHMSVVDVKGSSATDYLRKLLANDVARLKQPGRALYSAMLNPAGGVKDDLIVYRLELGYRLVVNCGTRDKDLAWMLACSDGFEVEIIERPDLALIAVQGPEALSILETTLAPAQQSVLGSLTSFEGAPVGDWFLARTGYTGELGVEIMLPNAAAEGLWTTLLAAGVRPIGLGARDTLRLEAGMNLYGQDMDEGHSPLSSNLAWTVKHNGRNFIGEAALLKMKADKGSTALVGLVMLDRGVLRAQYPVYAQETLVGEITSGAFSPTLQAGIGFARVGAWQGPLFVEIRGKRQAVEPVSLPFVRKGQIVYQKLIPEG